MVDSPSGPLMSFFILARSFLRTLFGRRFGVGRGQVVSNSLSGLLDMGNSSPTQKESDGILLQMLRAIVVVRPVNPLPMCSVNVDMRMLFGGIWVLTLLIRIGAATYPLGFVTSLAEPAPGPSGLPFGTSGKPVTS
ncbi:hypothetical protein LINPERHAP1_LOCUS24230 [Linum perenne]